MKNKLILNSILGLTIACPAMAEVNVDITAGTNNPGCNNTVLHTYSGPTSLEAEYTANTINLKWYGADGEITTVQNASKTCTYDGAIVLPTTNPTRTGYTFDGWQVRRAAPSNPQQSGFDLSTWNYGELPEWNANYIAWSPLNGVNGYTVADALEEDLEGGTDRSASLSNGEWAITFGNGTVKGVATCVSTGGEWLDTLAGNALQSGQYNDTDAQYCWCKATSVDTGSGYQSVASARWVFGYGGDVSADDCAADCAGYCASRVQYNADFRSAVFGVAQ